MDRFDPSTAHILAELSEPMAQDSRGISRRRFLQGIAVTGAASMLPFWLGDGVAGAAPIGPTDGVLVLLMMYGGNDSLSMVPPFENGHYRSLRSSMAYDASQVHQIGPGRGLHRSLGHLKQHWDQGHLAVIDGVGHPSPDLSHFTSMARWMSASTRRQDDQTGWLGRFADGVGGHRDAFTAVALGTSIPLTLAGRRHQATALPYKIGDIPSPDAGAVRFQFNALGRFSAPSGTLMEALAASGRESVGLIDRYRPLFNPALPTNQGSLAAQMTMAARLINANIGVRVLVVGYGDFDTHAHQRYTYDQRMGELNEALIAFDRELSESFANRTLVLTSSEFGRRPQVNSSAGTDHGTSATLLAFGRGVQGGMYGQFPELRGLGASQNPAVHVDYRQVYATVLSQWLDADPHEVIGQNYADLGFLARPSTGTSAGSVRHASRFEIARLYLAYLNRMPDEAGWEFWLAQRRRGTSLEAISAEFAGSPEFHARYGALNNAQFVDLIYRNVLDRAPDAEGRDHWISVLDRGTPRGVVMVGFSDSAEFINKTQRLIIDAEKRGAIGRLYLAYFDRLGDDAGLSHWLHSSAPISEIADGFAASAEFQLRYGPLDDQGFIRLAYRNVLKREPDDAGMAHWLHHLGTGSGRGQIMLELSRSPEFVALVNRR